MMIYGFVNDGCHQSSIQIHHFPSFRYIMILPGTPNVGTTLGIYSCFRACPWHISQGSLDFRSHCARGSPWPPYLAAVPLLVAGEVAILRQASPSARARDLVDEGSMTIQVVQVQHVAWEPWRWRQPGELNSNRRNHGSNQGGQPNLLRFLVVSRIFSGFRECSKTNHATPLSHKAFGPFKARISEKVTKHM